MIKTVKVFAGLYSIMLNGEKIGVAEKTNNGWAARSNATGKYNVRTTGYTKNEVVGTYVKEYIKATI